MQRLTRGAAGIGLALVMIVGFGIGGVAALVGLTWLTQSIMAKGEDVVPIVMGGFLAAVAAWSVWRIATGRTPPGMTLRQRVGIAALMFLVPLLSK